MLEKGPGSALLFFLKDMETLFVSVAADGDANSYIGSSEMTELMAKARGEDPGPSAEEVMASSASQISILGREGPVSACFHPHPA